MPADALHKKVVEAFRSRFHEAPSMVVRGQAASLIG